MVAAQPAVLLPVAAIQEPTINSREALAPVFADLNSYHASTISSLTEGRAGQASLRYHDAFRQSGGPVQR
jgi:hypothetical protein